MTEADSVALGDAWVEVVRHDLRVDHRPITGGWPGTMTEARARTWAHFHGALTADELELAARAVYGRARRRWLARADA